MKNYVQFRFVPTMRCNQKCPYCFLPHSSGTEPTMFDQTPPNAWVLAMNNFKNYHVEFYMWGGEPFLLDGTYEVVKGFCQYDHVKWARIDTNMTFAKKILKLCPSPKLKLNCSWHTHIFDFDQIWKLLKRLKEEDMIGMVNFVASDRNLSYLRENNLDLNDLVMKFMDHDIYLNIAPEFQKGSEEAYSHFMSKYLPLVDWEHITNQHPSLGVECDAANSLFTVEHNGHLTTCGVPDRAVGNFFTGHLQHQKTTLCPHEVCPSIISYCHRTDNDLKTDRHLERFVARAAQHRKYVGSL